MSMDISMDTSMNICISSENVSSKDVTDCMDVITTTLVASVLCVVYLYVECEHLLTFLQTGFHVHPPALSLHF